MTQTTDGEGRLEAIWIKRAHRGRMDSAFAQVLGDATIHVGDPVSWALEPARQ